VIFRAAKTYDFPLISKARREFAQNKIKQKALSQKNTVFA